jgi:DNA helicase-2/ATP-dependent DNA helicase PcrA
MKLGAGLKYEIEVWNTLKKTFQKDEAFAIHHYPMFFNAGATSREIDILFLHQQLGLFVIEVKGVPIEKIDKIQGHLWYFKNFRSESEAPYHQAKQQMYMLVNDLNKNLLMGKRLNQFTVIALPMVNEAEWCEKGFNQQLSVPTPIFKDDLQSPEAFRKKIESFTQDVKDRPLSEQDWLRIQMYFNLDIQEKTEVETPQNLLDVVKEQAGQEIRIPGTYQMKYRMQLFSRLYIFPTVEDFVTNKEEVQKLLMDGVKIYIFTYDRQVKEKCEEDYSAFLREYQLDVYIGQAAKSLRESHFDNGQGIEAMLNTLCEHFPEFNKGQFMAIHSSAKTQEMITAGAGTGKTHVMIDRILYLLICERVPLKDIIMLTFTNASTNEMKKRLEQKFIILFDLTNQAKYLQFAEEVRDMQISTIHSFAKKIIQRLAHEIGLGKNVKLRSFVYEKQLVIQQLIDDYFADKPVDFFKNHGLSYYEFTNFVCDMWEEMEKKGLSKQEILMLRWGKTLKKSSEISKLLQEIFEKCETEIDKIKQQQNAITMGDVIRKLKDFTANPETLKQLDHGRFIFVDEFQDSDDVQIELIAKLQTVLNYNLFVVGDIKQSIYRFRGADYRSFDELDKRKMPDSEFKKIPLQHNYRSSKQILDKMHTLFEIWGSMDEPLLTYLEKDRLISSAPSLYGKRDWIIEEYGKKKDWQKIVRDMLQNATKTRALPNSTIAVIVRFNYQAREMKRICNELGITTTENLDGTFFTTPVVKHFHLLLQGLIYPNEPKFLLNALETPYFNYQIPYQVLMLYKGNKEQLVSFICEKSKDVINKYVKLLRENSSMTVIQKIIYESKILQMMQYNFEQQGKTPEVAKLEALKYERNLQHLMTIIEKNFDQQQLSLYTLLNWLTLQMNTNRSENEPSINKDLAIMTITTVHRSKGLEYDTVIIPITDYPYNKVKSKIYIEEGNEIQTGQNRRIGWSLKKFKNVVFDDLSEVENVEKMKEEVRLLYVAFTRAEQRIMVLLPKGKVSDSWSHLLKEAGLKGNKLL